MGQSDQVRFKRGDRVRYLNTGEDGEVISFYDRGDDRVYSVMRRKDGALVIWEANLVMFVPPTSPKPDSRQQLG